MFHPLSQFRAINALSMEAFAEAIGATKSMVSKWERWISKPNDRYMQRIFDYTGGAIVPNDFYRISLPACSSAGEAGALSPPANPSGAPAISEQGGAEVAHRVHTPEVAGSIPVPATSFDSSGISSQSDGNAGAHGLRDARCAPAAVCGEAAE